ncbi:MAG: hypothetical protein M0R02_16535 [Bacteroidales bacterium]|nr:hypothetical protein [Bacteroidales bacterium]
MTSKLSIPETLGTQLLGEVLDSFAPDERHPLRILDLGPACGATVAFFSRYRCTLRFADLAPAQLCFRHDADDERGQREAWIEHLRPQLDLPANSRFDLCLFWDLLNHLDEEGVRALGALLSPHLHSASCGHGFAVHNRGAVLHHRSYGILDTGQLMITGQDSALRLRHPHPQSALNSLLGCLTVKRSVLRSDGRLEMSLSHGVC